MSRAERLGEVLFEHDSVGARARDAVHRRVHDFDTRVSGWLTLRNGDAWVVPFLTTDGGAIGTLYRVRFDNFADAAPAVEVLDVPETVDEATVRMFAAGETAKRQHAQRCSKRYSTVVVPGAEIGLDGWAVYLLARATEPDAIVSGGHHRFLISADGSRVVHHFQFTQACLTLRARGVPAGGRAVGTFITHLTSEAPTEVHVFLSLLHHAPFYVDVAEPRSLWKVQGSQIELIAMKD